MAKERIYRRTAAGTTAWQRQDPSVPVDYRRVLGAIETDTHPDTLCARLVRYSADELADMLEQLVERGLLEAVAAEKGHDLDFTGNFTRADLLR